LIKNISFRIVSKLIDNFPDCRHVSQHGLNNCEDHEIWEFSRSRNFVIVTFDSDFYDISLINGCPTKIIWIRTGIITTNELEQLLNKSKPVIFDFNNGKEYIDIACLEIIC